MVGGVSRPSLAVWRSLVAALALVTAGCVTLTPEQQDRVTEVRRLADATTAAYDVQRVRVTVEPTNRLGIGARYRQGNFYLNVRMLGSVHLDVVVAHELAHYLLGHDTLPTGVVTHSDWQRAQEQRELDANAKAVEILTRVRGMTEAEAVRAMVAYLRAAQQAVDRGSPVAAGHRQPVEEIADLLARFPGRH